MLRASAGGNACVDMGVQIVADRLRRLAWQSCGGLATAALSPAAVFMDMGTSLDLNLAARLALQHIIIYMTICQPTALAERDAVPGVSPRRVRQLRVQAVPARANALRGRDRNPMRSSPRTIPTCHWHWIA